MVRSVSVLYWCMSLALFGFLVTTIGELLIGYSILRVHSSLQTEKHIDKKVIDEVKKEKLWTMAGMALIAVGFIIQATSERFFI